MGNVTVKFNALEQHSTDLSKNGIKLTAAYVELKAARAFIALHGGFSETLSAGLKNAAASTLGYIGDVTSLRNTCNDAAEYYRSAEVKILLNSGWKLNNVGDLPGLMFRASIMGLGGCIVSGSKTSTGKVLGFNSSGSVSGSLFDHEVKKTRGFGNKFKIDKDGKKHFDELNIEAKNTYEGSVAKGSAEGNIGYLSGGITGQILTGTVSGAVGATLYKNGKLSPSIYAKAEAGVAVAKGKAEAKFGNDDYDAHVKAEGTLGGAEAKGSVSAGKITYDDGNGNIKTAYGVEGKAGAEAYVAKGSVKGGIKILGIDVDVKVSGTALGVGASIGGSATTNGVSGHIGGALGLGAGLDVTIDWSKFKYKFW